MKYSAALKVQIGNAVPRILYFTDFETQQANPQDWAAININTDMGISAALLFSIFDGDTGWRAYMPTVILEQEPVNSFTIIGDIVDRYGDDTQFLASEIDLRGYKALEMKKGLKEFLTVQVSFGAPLPLGSNPQNVINNIEATPIGQVQDLININGLGDVISVNTTPTVVKFIPCSDSELLSLDNVSVENTANHRDAYISLVKMIDFENPQIESAGWSKSVRKNGGIDPLEVSPVEHIEYLSNCSFTVYSYNNQNV